MKQDKVAPSGKTISTPTMALALSEITPFHHQSRPVPTNFFNRVAIFVCFGIIRCSGEGKKSRGHITSGSDFHPQESSGLITRQKSLSTCPQDTHTHTPPPPYKISERIPWQTIHFRGRDNLAGKEFPHVRAHNYQLHYSQTDQCCR